MRAEVAEAAENRGVSVSLIRIGMMLVLLVMAGCGGGDPSEYAPAFGDKPQSGLSAPEYTFTVHPLHNPVRLFEIYQPMIDAINRRASGFSVKLQPSRDYPSYEAKLRRHEP